MIITPDNWIDTSVRQPILGGGSMKLRRILVMHATCGATAQSSVDYWRNQNDGICTHLVIDRDGTIIQVRPFDRSCGHVRGTCYWTDPKTGNTYYNLNLCSIGIELANAENDPGAWNWLKKQPANHDGNHNGFEDYPEAQLKAAFEASKVIVARYNLDDVVSHASLDPSRRDDPGPDFPMADLRKACGFK